MKTQMTRNKKNSCYSRRLFVHSRWSASRGFSLVEVLVGAAVLIISVTGTLSIIAKNVSSAAIAAERVTAFYLAQEALEYVRGVRDNNAIGNHGWLDGLGDCSNGTPCTIDVTPDGDVENCVSSVCDENLYLSDEGTYNQRGDGIETVFTREVVIEDVRAGEEVRVHATVSWPQGGITRSFTISGNIFNWR